MQNKIQTYVINIILLYSFLLLSIYNQFKLEGRVANLIQIHSTQLAELKAENDMLKTILTVKRIQEEIALTNKNINFMNIIQEYYVVEIVGGVLILVLIGSIIYYPDFYVSLYNNIFKNPKNGPDSPSISTSNSDTTSTSYTTVSNNGVEDLTESLATSSSVNESLKSGSSLVSDNSSAIDMLLPPIANQKVISQVSINTSTDVLIDKEVTSVLEELTCAIAGEKEMYNPRNIELDILMNDLYSFLTTNLNGQELYAEILTECNDKDLIVSEYSLAILMTKMIAEAYDDIIYPCVGAAIMAANVAIKKYGGSEEVWSRMYDLFASNPSMFL